MKLPIKNPWYRLEIIFLAKVCTSLNARWYQLINTYLVNELTNNLQLIESLIYQFKKIHFCLFTNERKNFFPIVCIDQSYKHMESPWATQWTEVASMSLPCHVKNLYLWPKGLMQVILIFGEALFYFCWGKVL